MTTNKIDAKAEFRGQVNVELGLIGAIFMSQGNTPASKMVLPTEKLSESADRIELYAFALVQQSKEEERESIFSELDNFANIYDWHLADCVGHAHNPSCPVVLLRAKILSSLSNTPT